ncbi:uncharacterized protein B0T15DRAFT_228872 [Chaetomium strumarium]|uniref:SSCRP protein n=1 Tax=Chaetomium strumarium TaxID=1170767 RepID=A0AAJ0M040_9PEZI|nr:hypothetical protein B0T15DRAFT_228872 [Chaetomium strumarium]
MKTFASILLGLVAAVSAEDYVYYTGNRCTGDVVGSGTLACGPNPMPLSPLIHGIRLNFANGLRTRFHDNRDCSGAAWFTDDGTGGCVTDSAARTNCIFVPC